MGGDVHERLVDTTADEIEVYFETRDARTKRERITLAAPPAVRRASLTITPPSYAAAWFSALESDLGPGLDERAITETPALIGSDVTLELELNKPIPFPQDDETLRRTLGWGEDDLPRCTVDARYPDRWTLRWRLEETRRLDLHLVDEYGLGNTEPIAYRIDAVEDRLPAVTIMEPESDEPVLPTAVVPLRAEARDDVAVSVMLRRIPAILKSFATNDLHRRVCIGTHRFLPMCDRKQTGRVSWRCLPRRARTRGAGVGGFGQR